MKKRIIRIGVLATVFVLALIGFGFFTNRGNTDMTANMEAPTLPVISFVTGGKEANLLVAHKEEMNMISMRDTICVCNETDMLEVRISHNDLNYDSLKYEVYSLDGEKELYEDTIQDFGKKEKLLLKNVLKKDEEAFLKLTLTKNESALYYYTRIIKDSNLHLEEYLDYIEELHTNMITKKNEDAVKKVMEPSAQGDKASLQHVTIHSDLNRTMWGELKPKVVGELQFEIQEIKEAYASVQLKYQVECKGENNDNEIYNVKEFFKVAYGKERIYLIEYDRRMEEVFQTTNLVLGSKGIILGITDEVLEHKVSEDGKSISFVQANQLWSYHKTDNIFTHVFSFSASENSDLRNHIDNHSIQILSVENEGNMTFSVCGYMNRGIHEGESGVAIYYYNHSKKMVDEIAFIPSCESKLVIEEELNELAYYNREQNVLYVMAQGNLLKIELENYQQQVLMDDFGKVPYVVSEDGHLLAYQKTKKGETATEIWDFAKDKKKIVEANAGEIVIPLGFMGSDFVYGISTSAEVGYDFMGNEMHGMTRLEIRNQKNEVIKTYKKDNVYILGATIEANQIIIKQGTKTNNIYTETTEDYITNNETSSSEFVQLDSYWTDLKQTQYRLAFSVNAKSKKPRSSRTKFMLQETPTVLDAYQSQGAKYYYVYGHGEQLGVFEEAGDAVELADSVSGVVISPQHNYVWEDGNRQAYYRNFKVDRFTSNVGENTLAASVRKVLSYEGEKVNVVAELEEMSVEQVLKKYLDTEILRFRGCSSKDMFYLIDKGVPVIAMKNGSSAILLIGYDAKTVTYVEPSSGSIFTSAIEKVDSMLEASGKTFLAYVK